MRGGRRPILVWLIFLFIIFSTAFTAVSVLVLTSGNLPPEVQAKIGVEAIRPIDIVAGLFEAAVYFVAAIALFMMRKLAFYLFAGAFVMEIGLVVWTLADRSHAITLGIAGGDMAGFVGMVAIGLAFLLFIYTLNLMMSERLA